MVEPDVQYTRWIEECSSLQSYSMCDYCNKKLANKYSLIKHFKVCGVKQKLICDWCKISFTNRGNLALHTLRIHSKAKVNESPKTDPCPSVLKCEVCDTYCKSRSKLNYHIRLEHFNLKAKMPSCELKKVNQIWFEKVLNTNIVMEIRKTRPNVLVMRKLGPNTAIKIYNDANEDITDLSHLYPTSEQTKRNKRRKCPICSKIIDYRSLQKHINEKHRKIAKHQCNNCLRSFKRHYIFLRHVCFKGRKKRNVLKNENDTNIICKQLKKDDLRSRLLRNNLPFKSKH